MKKLLTMVAMAAALCVFAKDQYDIKPEEAKANDAPTAVEWQNKNDATLKALTADDVLASFVRDEASAKALLAKVQPAYATDPMAAMQIGAVTQWVMVEDKKPWYVFGLPLVATPHSDGRKVWVKALFDTMTAATDDYVAEFCLDQLRWCGKNAQADKVLAVGQKSGSKAVNDFAAMVAKELKEAK